MAYGLYAYPWNLQNAPQDVARIKDLGITHITLAAAYHAGKFIHPGDARARVYFPEDGTVYFKPRRNYGILTPKVAAITQEHDILAALTERQDISVNAWVVLNHNSRLGFAHGAATVRNCFGDAYPYSLCPANPAVRDYAIILCEDLAAHYGVQSLLLESPGYMTYSHGYHHEFAQAPMNAWLDAMLGLCFCDYCVAGANAAGIGASELKARIARRIDHFLDGGLSPDETMAAAWLQHDLVEDPDLARFLRWRCDRVTSLVGDIRAAVKRETLVKVIATTQRPHATAFWEGGDLAALHKISEGLELPLYQPSPQLVASDAAQTLGRLNSKRPVSVILRPGHPDMTSQGQLDDTLDRLEVQGITDISFYNYGMLRAHNLEWLGASLTRRERGLHV